MTSSNVGFSPPRKDIQFTVKEEEINWKTFTFKKLESEDLVFFILIMTQNDESVIKIVGIN